MASDSTQAATGASNPLRALFGSPVGTTSSSVSGGAEDTEDRFLKLLVAQMRNQDPLNPLDNAQVTMQMAQISTVRGVETLNQSMSQLVAQLGQTSATEALAVIGRQVLVAGDTLERSSASEGAMGAGFELAAAADSVEVRIVDESGRVVFERDWQGLDAGLQLFQWDGNDSNGNPAPAGNYRVEVDARAGEAAVEATALVPIRVLGISPGGSGMQIELAGRRAVGADEIKAIL